MGKKNKKRQESRRRYSEKKRRYARLWDWTTLAMLAVIVIGALIVYGASLGKVAASSASFAGWFLLVIGYLPLLLVEAVELLLGLAPTAPAAASAAMLGITDAIFLALIWLGVRLIGQRRPPDFTRCAWHFLLIFFYWGLFQLLCCGLSLLWAHHRVVHEEQPPAPVIALVAKNGK